MTLGNFVPTHLPCLHGARGVDRSLGRTCTALIFVVVSFCTPTSPSFLSHISPAWCSRGDVGIRIRRLWGGNANMPDQTHSCRRLLHLLMADKRPPHVSKDPSNFDAKFCQNFSSRSSGYERAFRARPVGRNIYADDDGVDDGFDLGSVIIL